MLGTKIHCHGCGRTDAGVHASQYFCSITIDKEIDFDFVFRINKMLPPSIVVYDLIPVHAKANAQYDATRRTYDYFFHFEKNPFLHDISTFYPVDNWDIDLLHEAIQLVSKQKDFKAFCKTPDIYKHTCCDIFDVKYYWDPDQKRIKFQICANRFLRGMMRILTANLLEVATRKLPLAAFTHCLESGERPQYHRISFPQGLYLSKVEYPYLVLPPKGSLNG